jgi:outer membrane lipoprotein-sorting protein
VVAGRKTIYGQPAYVIEIRPKTGTMAGPMIPGVRGATPPHVARLPAGVPAPSTTPATTMRVWVERQRWLIRKMEALSGPSNAELRFDYQQVAGKYWLPKRVVAKAEWTGRPMSANLPGQRTSTRLPSRATVTFDFSNYRVNVGLPASLFRPAPPPKTPPARPGHDPDEAR